MAFRLNSISPILPRTFAHLTRSSTRPITQPYPKHSLTPKGATRSPLREMSSDAARPAITTPPAGKYEFLVVVPDKPGMQEKRLEVRSKHFEGLKDLIENGIFKVGGAVMNSPPEGADATKWDFHGSTVVMIAESVEECREVLKKDIYNTSGVWDVEKAQIWPVKLAFRYP